MPNQERQSIDSNKAYDPAKISFSAIPKFKRYTVSPKFFLYQSDKTRINVGINTTLENRLGGDMRFIEGNGDSTHSYFERNKTKRFSSQFTLEHRAINGGTFTINQLEKSYGINGDIIYRTSFDQIAFSINQFFFYILLKHPLFIEPGRGGFYQLQNIPGEIVSKGAETNIKLGYDELALYLGDTYTHGKIYSMVLLLKVR